MHSRKIPELKPLLEERMNKLLPNKEDFQKFLEVIRQEPQNSIRCNTLKISPEELLIRLGSKGWIVEQPFKNYPEIMIVKGKFVNDKIFDFNKIKDKADPYLKNRYQSASDSERNIIDLEPGELGRSMEHLLGYYYVQEIASMLPVLVLEPRPNQTIIDLCASPGSKTTQIAAAMENKGTVIANEVSLPRIIILASNMERCGAANVIITRKEGSAFCKKLNDRGFQFDKILVDAPCSGEGTLRSNPATAIMWNINTVRQMSAIQKNLLSSAIELLKINGDIVYSTCTHAPEEDEEVIDFVLKKFGDKIEVKSIKLPIKCRPGLANWNNKPYNKEVTKACRIYPQDNNTEGFFIAKLRKIK
jgi:NOL1/NOP2/sun family putative RNA methylase